MHLNYALHWGDSNFFDDTMALVYPYINRIPILHLDLRLAWNHSRCLDQVWIRDTMHFTICGLVLLVAIGQLGGKEGWRVSQAKYSTANEPSSSILLLSVVDQGGEILLKTRHCVLYTTSRCMALDRQAAKHRPGGPELPPPTSFLPCLAHPAPAWWR